jgi:hypothetical protein
MREKRAFAEDHDHSHLLLKVGLRPAILVLL